MSRTLQKSNDLAIGRPNLSVKPESKSPWRNDNGICYFKGKNRFVSGDDKVPLRVMQAVAVAIKSPRISKNAGVMGTQGDADIAEVAQGVKSAS